MKEKSKEQLISQKDFYIIQSFKKDNALMIADTFINDCYICIKDDKVFGIYPKHNHTIEEVEEDLREFDNSEYTLFLPVERLEKKLDKTDKTRLIIVRKSNKKINNKRNNYGN